MKTFFITIIYIVFACQLSSAQEPPTPPTPPSTSSHSSISSKKTGSTSVSISHTEDEYKLRARFPKDREAKLKQLIQNTLGDKNLDVRKGYSKWSNDEKVYEIKLTEKSLRIWLDLDIASAELIEKFKTLGSDAKTIISGSSASAETNRMQREADRMRREADRMQREAKRLEKQVLREARQAEREAARVNQNIARDAKRLEIEAKRLDLRARRIEEKARHKGGISNHIKRLLNDPKTTYTAGSGKNLNWIWPDIQKELLQLLVADKLIDSENDVAFTAEKDEMYVNGKVIADRQKEIYRKLFSKAGIKSNTDFSFYKKEDRIVVIGLNAKIKNFFKDLKTKGFIASTDEPVKLFINGNSITQNGTRLSSDKVAAYNTILSDNGIIPAPGKCIEMEKAGSYRLGYSIGSKGHVGTWIEED